MRQPFQAFTLVIASLSMTMKLRSVSVFCLTLVMSTVTACKQQPQPQVSATIRVTTKNFTAVPFYWPGRDATILPPYSRIDIVRILADGRDVARTESVALSPIYDSPVKPALADFKRKDLIDGVKPLIFQRPVVKTNDSYMVKGYRVKGVNLIQQTFEIPQRFTNILITYNIEYFDARRLFTNAVLEMEIVKD